MNDKNNNNNAKTGGVGFTSLLQLTFIILKLTNVIDWNWFWVLSPFIFSIGLVILILIIFFIALRIING